MMRSVDSSPLAISGTEELVIRLGCMSRRTPLYGAFASAVLCGCTASPSSNSVSQLTGNGPALRAGDEGLGSDLASSAPQTSELPFIAVNTVDAVLPLGRTRGLLTFRQGCVVFQVRGQLYTPIWPSGTYVSEDSRQVHGRAGDAFRLNEEVTLDGASFSLENERMRLREPLPERCPNATYAVNL